MGLCSSAEPQPDELLQRSRQLDKMLSAAEKQDEIKKLLLLGAGESGKSTLFKQMKQIYGKGFSEEDKRHAVNVINENVTQSMNALITQANKKYGKILCEASMNAFLEHKQGTPFTIELGVHVKTLWEDPGIQSAYQHRNRFQLNDSAAYFFNKIEEIAAPGFLPTDQDVLRSRMPTTGIVENTYHIDGNQFRMVDVGGQRSERRKWIHCFDGVTAVLFVASLSEYDQVLYEDDEQPRILEALELFEEISNSQWFEKTSMILFLNKRDLFAEKITRVPIKSYFPAYSGSQQVDDGAEFFQQMFVEKSRHEQPIYTHVTCATDTNNVRAVFTIVKDIVIRTQLGNMALMFHPWNGRSDFNAAEPSAQARETLTSPCGIHITKPLLAAMLERERELRRERRDMSVRDIHFQVAEEFGFEDCAFGAQALQNAAMEQAQEVVLRHRTSLFDSDHMEPTRAPFKQLYIVV